MTQPKPPCKILFLCTGNSARSILAEFLLRKIAPATFETYSAGSHPKASPHPLTLEVLSEDYQLDIASARSKSWMELKEIPFDFVITLCGDARESCPVWPGQPVVAHWPFPDPAGFEGTREEQRRFFLEVARQIHHRLERFASLPLEKLDALRLETAIRELGQGEKPASDPDCR